MTFLGFDFSTQQIKVVALDEDLTVIYENFVSFDIEIPEFNTSGGVFHRDEKTVTAPIIMWIKALDILLQKMKTENFNFLTVKALSGCGQQHGTVYWNYQAAQLLCHLDPNLCFHEQLKDAFSILNSPVWMDSSTSVQCKILENVAGGACELAKLTGSKAFERFSGSQILKIFMNDIKGYEKTERISLVSSFASSLFLGLIANIDESDAGGMNLMDIVNKKWNIKLCEAVAPSLIEKLGSICCSTSVLGNISTYLKDRYGFNSNCKVVAFTGDNPSSMAGMALREGDICISLGTSDCVFFWSSKLPTPKSLGCFVLVNCVDSSAYMAMLCFKNGSLIREAARDKYADGSWQRLTELLSETSAGNDGRLGLFYDLPEIVPQNICGRWRFNPDDSPHGETFSAPAEVRALLEGQLLSRRGHVTASGFSLSGPGRLFVTGGASTNSTILQLIANVFQKDVYSLDIPNSAALGGAYRAKHGFLGGWPNVQFEDVFQQNMHSDLKILARPAAETKEIYDTLVERYMRLESQLIQNGFA